MSSAWAADDFGSHVFPGRRGSPSRSTTSGLLGPSICLYGPIYRRGKLRYGPFHYATVNASWPVKSCNGPRIIPVDDYIIETLFTRSVITAFKFQKSSPARVMTGGGNELRAIDLWRIGQLVSTAGGTKDGQILPGSVDQRLSHRP